ncbi:molybdenum cofactor guanylyltransferase [Desulfotomaculum copahuensis]|uniref:Probable molybdenum cofactor guanylyltransferase n=1 Tax=Desulfotomaculum copahuensis TaxID=1838280 RepID=A0A1B7LBG0_9FIRM|nr:molybdenum cofactor guanylyltransferase [Desulfotomaculum copahuensis]OAT79876.1 hypothetical protein A6M21_14860 [Desulfotomaculum copahuensis]
MIERQAKQDIDPSGRPAVTGVVLAGGNSSRMGANKALLKLAGRRLIERVVCALQNAFGRVMLVVNNFDDYRCLGLPMVSDVYPGRGPLSGIHAGLLHAKTPYIFVAACDLPLADARLARHMAALAPGSDVVIARSGGCLEPLFAVYSRECLAPVENLLRSGRRCRVVDFFPMVRIKYIDRADFPPGIDAERVFLNINTPADLQRAGSYLPAGRECGRN